MSYNMSVILACSWVSLITINSVTIIIIVKIPHHVHGTRCHYFTCPLPCFWSLPLQHLGGGTFILTNPSFRQKLTLN